MTHSQVKKANIIAFMTIGVALRYAIVGAVVVFIYSISYSLWVGIDTLTQQEIFIIPIAIFLIAINGLQLGAVVGFIVGSVVKWNLRHLQPPLIKHDVQNMMYKVIISFALIVLAVVIVGVIGFSAIAPLPWIVSILAIMTVTTLYVAHRYLNQLS